MSTAAPDPNPQSAYRSSALSSLRESGLSDRSLLGRALAVGGAILVPILLFLPYASVESTPFSSGGSASGWKVLHGTDIMLLLVALATVGVVIADTFVAPSFRLRAAAAALGFVLVGLAWPELLGFASWGAGAFLVLVCALACAVGAVLALAEPASDHAAQNPFVGPSAPRR